MDWTAPNMPSNRDSFSVSAGDEQQSGPCAHGQLGGAANSGQQGGFPSPLPMGSGAGLRDNFGTRSRAPSAPVSNQMGGYHHIGQMG